MRVATAPRLRKGIATLRHRPFLKTFIRYRVVAASEHLDPIQYCAANTLIDVGANKGQFSVAFRSVRPHARIIAFEPLPEAAKLFSEIFHDDSKTELHRTALADEEGKTHFYVADRSDSSSLLKPGSGQERAFGVRPKTEIEVTIRKLENCIDIDTLQRPILMKVDVQGGELAVFEGFESLESVDFIYVELSFVELYDNQPLFQEVNEYLTRRGFLIAGVYNQVSTPEFGPTQVDVLFTRGRHRS